MPVLYPSPDVRKIPTTAQLSQEIEERRAYQPKRRHELCEHKGVFAIVQFLRLPDDSAAADRFRQDWGRYFPSTFWDESLPSDEELYRGTVVLNLPAVAGASVTNSHLAYLHSKPRLFWQGYRDLLRAAWTLGFPDEYIPRLLNLPGDEEDYVAEKAPRVVGIGHLCRGQFDILTMLREPWRAKVCNWCHLPFVPPPKKPAQQYCPRNLSSSCSDQAERAKKLSWWNKNKGKYRSQSKRRRN
jgi:hypothetical protein